MRNILMMMMMGFLLIGVSSLGAQNLDQFYAANQAYKEGDHKKAIELYEKFISGGKVSGEVFYNLGNSYFKDGQLGKAVLNYERGRQLIPRDGDLRANYEYALSQVKKSEGESRASMLEKFYRQYADFWTLDELTWILYLLAALAAVLHLLGLWLKGPAKNTNFFLVLLIVVLVWHGFILIDKKQANHNLAVVVADTQAKFEPRDNATTYFELAEGWTARIIAEEGGWYKLKRKDGKIGWAKKEKLEKI